MNRVFESLSKILADMCFEELDVTKILDQPESVVPLWIRFHPSAVVVSGHNELIVTLW